VDVWLLTEILDRVSYLPDQLCEKDSEFRAFFAELIHGLATTCPNTNRRESVDLGGSSSAPFEVLRLQSVLSIDIGVSWVISQGRNPTPDDQVRMSVCADLFRPNESDMKRPIPNRPNKRLRHCQMCPLTPIYQARSASAPGFFFFRLTSIGT